MSKNLLFLVLLVGFTANAQDALITKNPGRAPSGKLKIKKSKVPSYDIFKAKDIPRLDIGEEAELEASQFQINLEKPTLSLKPVEKQQSPKTPEWNPKNMGPITLTNAKEIANSSNLSRAPEVKTLAEVPPAETQDPQLNLVELINMRTNDFKLLEALIYLEVHKHYEQALGLLAELIQQNDIKHDALYHFAIASQILGINIEFRHNMFRVAKEAKNKELQTDAVQSLADRVESLAISDMKELEPLVNKHEIDITQNPAYNFYRAKYYLEEGNLGQVEDALVLIPENSKFFKESLLISSLYNYRRGKIDEAVYNLEKLIKITDKEDSLRPIAALTLGRFQFQKGNYKEAFDAYLLVDKSNSLWLQAMVEQAWAQILMNDYEGAAGNMFALHTDFFKHAFAPDSYVVRSVAYLNLCQFGDSAQALDNLKRKYYPYRSKIEDYKKSKKETKNYYETVRTWLKNSDLKEVDGLPRSVIAELARSPAFMKIQTGINNSEDEMEKFNEANLKIIQREKELIKLQSMAKEEIAKLKEIMKNPNAVAADIKVSIQQQERKLNAYHMQYNMTNKARSFIKEVREKSISRLDKEKVDLRQKAAVALKAKFDSLVSDMDKVLEQNEVLSYELYSGAGEHMRYQASGGEIDTATQRKPAGDKNVQWKFKGEIWEDEVGHFRSSLKNICPKEDSPTIK